jgi:serine/threonine protein kinase
MLRPELAQDKDMAARFFMEARAMSRVQHSGLIHIYEYGHLDDGGAYIIMEYVEGKNLREHILTHGGRIHPAVASVLARQIASALHAAHEQGVVHRDLKPENIQIVSTDDSTSMDSRIKILDFGIAKSIDAGSEAQGPKTEPGQVLGTPTYMAPEQAGAPGGTGKHTDVYALGVIFFEMLSGTPPFVAEDAIQMVGKHLFTGPPRLKEILPDIDSELDELLNRMLSKAPEHRPTMREVKTQLGPINRRLSEGKSRLATNIEDNSGAQTFILRKPNEATISAQVPSLLKPLSVIRQKPILLIVLVVFLSVVMIGIWLVLSTLSQKTSPSAPSTPLGEARDGKSISAKDEGGLQPRSPSPSAPPGGARHRSHQSSVGNQSNSPTSTKPSRRRSEAKALEALEAPAVSEAPEAPTPRIVD